MDEERIITDTSDSHLTEDGYQDIEEDTSTSANLNDDSSHAQTAVKGELVEDRKKQLAIELEKERQLKIKERQALAYRLKHGIESDDEGDDDKTDVQVNIIDDSTSDYFAQEETEVINEMNEEMIDTSSPDHMQNLRLSVEVSSTIESIQTVQKKDDTISIEEESLQNEEALHEKELEGNDDDLSFDEELEKGEITIETLDKEQENLEGMAPLDIADGINSPEFEHEVEVANYNDDNDDDDDGYEESAPLDFNNVSGLSAEEVETSSSEHTIFYQHLKSGFDFVQRELKSQSPRRKRKENTSLVPPSDIDGLSPAFIESIQQSPILNFIDPTSNPVRHSEDNDDENSPSRHMKRKAWNRDRPKLKLRELHIFPKFDTAFHRHNGSTLRGISYRNLRTNEVEMIDYLPLKTVLNCPTVPDPIEWHNSPICHVYIAACLSVDHYRAKVRPSLQAFVNQIDGAGSGNVTNAISAAKKAATPKKGFQTKREQVAAANKAVAAAKDAAGGNTSSKYIIIFIPIHPSSVDAEMPTQVDDAFKHGGLGLGRRLAAAAARRNQSAADRQLDDDKSIMSTITDDSSTISAQIQTLSKEHREVHKKFLHDFPNAKTCILSTLLDSNNDLAPESPIQKQELHTLCQELGKTVLSGFVDRIKRYNGELKRLEFTPSSPGHSPSKRKGEDIDWKRFFLMKESVALTYEQMKLPLEAMNQYEELETKLPIGPLVEVERDYIPENIRIIASTGRTKSFRTIVKSMENIHDIAHLVSMYVFARQVKLLFLQKFPRAAVNKCLAYVKKIHKIRRDQAHVLGTLESKNVLITNDVWAISSCWDLKLASEGVISEIMSNAVTETPSSPGSPERRKGSMTGLNEKAFVTTICNVMNFTRMCMLRLSSEIFSPDAIIRQATADQPPDALKPWPPWTSSRDVHVPNIEYNKPIVPFELWSQGAYTKWMLKALDSDKYFEDSFIEVCDGVIQMDTYLKRQRSVSRILAELAEIYILRGDLQRAVENLMIIVQKCIEDPWEDLLSWRVFRLASCQRIITSTPEYLKSLTYCLSSRVSNASPLKFRRMLTLDLLSVLEEKEISDFTWDLNPLFGTVFSVQETTKGRDKQQLLKTDVIMNNCEIGDEVKVDLKISSNLTESFEAENIEIFLLRINDYQRLAESNDEVSRADAAFVLCNCNPVKILPGDNDLSFSWAAMSVGQYVISSICMKWKNASFFEHFTIDAENRGASIVGLDVLPNEPTQSIELNPIFLIPGHVQNVRLIFNAGSDVVHNGKVKLTCSKGLQVKPPEASEESSADWQDVCEFELGDCLPNKSKTLIATVKSDAITSYTSNVQRFNDNSGESTYSNSGLQTLDAEVTTSYHHGLFKAYVEGNKPIESPPITAILEASITTLELAALTIKNSKSYVLDNSSFMLSATVLCNTPVAFSLKKWDIQLPPTLKLDSNGDFNTGLYDKSVIEGEELFFGFKCHASSESNDKGSSDSAVLSIILQDQFGKSFRQVLHLDISLVEKHLVTLEECSKDSSAIAVLTASELHGLVGSPVTLTYTIDMKGLELRQGSKILYHLSTAEAGWIVGGSVRGLFTYSSEENMTLSFVGIPIKAGTLKSFPRLEMTLVHDSNDISLDGSLEIKVKQKHPSAFLTSAYNNVDAMACASIIEV